MCKDHVRKNHFSSGSSTAHILDDTLKYIALDLKGAMTGAKFVLNKTVKSPIVVNPYQNICLFPSKSPQKIDCIWFNPEHIVNTKAIGTKTEVELSNGHSMIVDARLTTFNNKLQTANQLRRLSAERGNQPIPILIYHEPQKGRQLHKLKSGKYNFGILEEKNEK